MTTDREREALIIRKARGALDKPWPGPAREVALQESLEELLAVFEQAHTPTDDERDALAKAMCTVETRSKAASLEEVQAGIQRWTRHRYEAERLIEELADAGFALRRAEVTEPQGEPSDAPRDGTGKPLTRNSRGEWVNEIGDTRCPNDGEFTNKRCWKCGWLRAAGGVR